MPAWLDALKRWMRRRPMAAGLGALLLALVLYWQLTPASPRRAGGTAPPEPPVYRGAMPPEATLEKAVMTMQKESEQLRTLVTEQQRQIVRLERAQQLRIQTRDQERAEQERRLEAALQQALAQRPPAGALAPRAAPAPPPPPPAPQVRILRPAHAPQAPAPPKLPPLPLPPVGTRLPAGSFVRAQLLTGLFATDQGDGALPVLLLLTEAVTGPNHTTIPLQGCLGLGKAQADLTALRAIVQLTQLSCVLPSGQTFEQPVQGYVTGRDGTLGLPGRLEQRSGAYVSRTFLAALIAGAADAFAQAETTSQVTPLGGSIGTVTGNAGKFAAFSGLATASAQVAEFYIAQASKLLPVVWVESGQEAWIILQQGVTIEGLPAVAALPRPSSGLD